MERSIIRFENKTTMEMEAWFSLVTIVCADLGIPLTSISRDENSVMFENRKQKDRFLTQIRAVAKRENISLV